MSYTYLITHKETGLKYYGCRYAKICDPTELLVTYFTSSKLVKKMIEEEGIDSFDYEIRRIFDDDKAAIKWETKVLKRLKVPYNENYLNFCTNHPPSQEEKQSSMLALYGVDNPMKLDKFKNKAKATLLEKYGEDNPMKINIFVNKAKNTRMERYGVEYTWHIPEVIEKSKQTRLKTIGVEWTMQCPSKVEESKKTQIDRYGDWKIATDEVVEKRKEASMKLYGVDNPFKNPDVAKNAMLEKYGVDNYSKTPEGRKKIADSWIDRELIKCPYCDKMSKSMSLMKRWHFDNCKHKKVI